MQMHSSEWHNVTVGVLAGGAVECLRHVFEASAVLKEEWNATQASQDQVLLSRCMLLALEARDAIRSDTTLLASCFPALVHQAAVHLEREVIARGTADMLPPTMFGPSGKSRRVHPKTIEFVTNQRGGGRNNIRLASPNDDALAQLNHSAALAWSRKKG